MRVDEPWRPVDLDPLDEVDEVITDPTAGDRQVPGSSGSSTEAGIGASRQGASSHWRNWGQTARWTGLAPAD